MPAALRLGDGFEGDLAVHRVAEALGECGVDVVGVLREGVDVEAFAEAEAGHDAFLQKAERVWRFDVCGGGEAMVVEGEVVVESGDVFPPP